MNKQKKLFSRSQPRIFWSGKWMNTPVFRVFCEMRKCLIFERQINYFDKEIYSYVAVRVIQAWRKVNEMKIEVWHFLSCGDAISTMLKMIRWMFRVKALIYCILVLFWSRSCERTEIWWIKPVSQVEFWDFQAYPAGHYLGHMFGHVAREKRLKLENSYTTAFHKNHTSFHYRPIELHARFAALKSPWNETENQPCKQMNVPSRCVDCVLWLTQIAWIPETFHFNSNHSIGIGSHAHQTAPGHTPHHERPTNNKTKTHKNQFET